MKDLRVVSTGPLRGFAVVHLPSGMILHGCSIFSKDGKVWAAPPSKQVVGRDGTVQKNRDGKTLYDPVVSFVARATQERWSAMVIEALQADFPEALR